MDDIVKQALAKWPNVPHCYGWLTLDARGIWRMCNEQAQKLGLPGEKIVHTTLIAFINRNYTQDERGGWYFQNGPQRVYVTLETSPYIARTDPEHGFILHTGTPLLTIDAVWLTEDGQLILQNAEKIALLDDRDMGECLEHFRLDGNIMSDDQLMTWLKNQPNDLALSFHQPDTLFQVRYIATETIEAHFGFIRIPQATISVP
jgi:Protein of unknown function (DUF2946)